MGRQGDGEKEIGKRRRHGDAEMGRIPIFQHSKKE